MTPVIYNGSSIKRTHYYLKRQTTYNPTKFHNNISAEVMTGYELTTLRPRFTFRCRDSESLRLRSDGCKSTQGDHCE